MIVQELPLYRGFFEIRQLTLKHRLFQGGWTTEVTREVFVRPEAVAVLLYDEGRASVVIIEQFRSGAAIRQEKAWLFEVVAGILEEGETLEAVAHREAKEEAGCDIVRLEKICRYYSSPGGSSELVTR